VTIPSERAKQRGADEQPAQEQPQGASPEQVWQPTNGSGPQQEQPTGAGAAQGTVQFPAPDQQSGQSGGYGQSGQSGAPEGPASAVPPNYGAPPGWTPATSPGAHHPSNSQHQQYNWLPSWERGQQGQVPTDRGSGTGPDGSQ